MSRRPIEMDDEVDVTIDVDRWAALVEQERKIKAQFDAALDGVDPNDMEAIIRALERQ